MPLESGPVGTVLIVVAHPDDEVLGAGGLASVLTSQGNTVTATMLCGAVDARNHRPSVHLVHRDAVDAAETLGMTPPILGDFPNIKMNVVPHIELVQFIEDVIVKTRATSILTHHPSDLNDDHRQVSSACQAAARISQRRGDVESLRSLHYMEVLSSTDWAFTTGSTSFSPDSFIELTKQHLDQKIKALGSYRDVMRPYPHPRSREALEALSTMRGAQSGLDRAEAFQSAFLDMAALQWG